MASQRSRSRVIRPAGRAVTTTRVPRLFLDTNPVIRLLTADHPNHAARSRALFDRAARGELSLYLSESVVVEIVNVLSSRQLYNVPRAEIERMLRQLMSLPGLHVPLKATYHRALALWAVTPAVRDFTDALSVAHTERLKLAAIASFDADFDRFPTISRQEP